ncbi:hypothetical protein SUBVAR_04830 [Subdoligranulum variabile DSM 15176]|uniref:Uncharacterized protein n=1 Tax=Subdoligranulum variabile DSM 15176 TaxID=411471 RepID=D1PKF4_9FIRM|nr:hypothetical protein SUBVAR_04830 [Subdoligranulum variabile DSM 15176]
MSATLTVHGGGVPQVQTQFHRFIKNGLQFLFKQMVPKYLIPTGGTSAPGPGTHCDFRHLCIHKRFPPSCFPCSGQNIQMSRKPSPIWRVPTVSGVFETLQ